MRRYLVLTSEAAGHPFRRTLPPAVLTIDPATRDRATNWREDARFAATTFCGAFVAIFGLFG